MEISSPKVIFEWWNNVNYVTDFKDYCVVASKSESRLLTFTDREKWYENFDSATFLGVIDDSSEDCSIQDKLEWNSPMAIEMIISTEKLFGVSLWLTNSGRSCHDIYFRVVRFVDVSLVLIVSLSFPLILNMKRDFQFAFVVGSELVELANKLSSNSPSRNRDKVIAKVVEN